MNEEARITWRLGSANDIVAGAGMGLAVGIAFGFMATLSFALGGGDDLDVNLARLWVMYTAGGIIVGSVVGLGRPLWRSSTLGRTLVGAVAAIPGYFIFRWGFALDIPSAAFEVFLLVFFVLAFGVVGPFLMR